VPSPSWFRGVLVGGLIGWLNSGRQIGAQDRLPRQERLIEIVWVLWAASDALWRANQDLGYVNQEKGIARWSGDRTEYLDELEARRQRHFVEIRDSQARAASALGWWFGH